MRKIIASLDIGTNTIKLIVGEMIKEKLNVLTLAESPSKGVVNGKIINLDLLVPIIKNTLKKAEDILDLKVHKLIITVPSNEAQFLMSDGYTTITNEEKISVLKEHFELLLKEKGEYTATREIRKFVAWYVKGMKDCRRFKEKMNTINSINDFYNIF